MPNLRRAARHLTRPPDNAPAGLASRWRAACQTIGLTGLALDPPLILTHTPTPTGHRLHVRLPDGWTFDRAVQAAGPLAAAMDVYRVRLDRDHTAARRAHITVLAFDPLAKPLPGPWPWLDADRVDLWTADIPVGIDEDGCQAAIRLAERHLLLGGEPGAGKSVALSMPLAAAALDPTVTLMLADGALVELAPWRDRADLFVGNDPAAFLDLLNTLRAELDRRIEGLLARGARKVTPGDGVPLIVLVVDELAFFLNVGRRAQNDEINIALRDLIARCRKAGIIVIAATQKPSSDVLPTSIRDLFALRWGFRVTTPDASDTILGRGHALAGYSATDIPIEQRGIGWLRAEGTVPRRLRTYYLTDAHLDQLAARAVALRAAERPVGEQGSEEAA